MVAALLVGLVAFGFVWWATGVSIDAADALRPAPDAVRFTPLAVYVVLGSVATFVASSILAIRRERARR